MQYVIGGRFSLLDITHEFGNRDAVASGNVLEDGPALGETHDRQTARLTRFVL